MESSVRLGIWHLWQSFLTAMALLSIFPVPKGWLQEHDNPHVQGGSLLFYPVIGLFIGLSLVAASFFLTVFGPMLTAVLLVSIWVVLTGALHLDGLADTADAWLGGHGDRARTLIILKDTQIGVAAVVALVLALLLKVLAVQDIQKSLIIALIVTPILSRTMVMALILTTPYVRDDGIASQMTRSLPKIPAWSVITIIFGITVVILQWHAIFILISVVLVFYLFRLLMIRRIRGITGDTAGAFIEIIEIILLLDFAAIEFILT